MLHLPNALWYFVFYWIWLFIYILYISMLIIQPFMVLLFHDNFKHFTITSIYWLLKISCSGQTIPHNTRRITYTFSKVLWTSPVRVSASGMNLSRFSVAGVDFLLSLLQLECLSIHFLEITHEHLCARKSVVILICVSTKHNPKWRLFTFRTESDL